MKFLIALSTVLALFSCASAPKEEVKEEIKKEEAKKEEVKQEVEVKKEEAKGDEIKEEAKKEDSDKVIERYSPKVVNFEKINKKAKEDKNIKSPCRDDKGKFIKCSEIGDDKK